jgi:hypothetical protein
MDSSPIATVRPEKTTARPAWFIASTHGIGVLTASRTLLAPAAHHEERVVDRDPEADQRDQELDDLADVRDLRQATHDEERRHHGNPADQQRQQCEETRIDERQDQQRAERPDHGLDHDSRALVRRGGLAVGEQLRPRHTGFPAGGRGVLQCVLQHRAEARAAESGHRRCVDQGERGPAVLGDECGVVGGRVVGDPRVQQRRRRGREDPAGLRGDRAVADPLAGGDRQHRHERGLRSAVAVCPDDLVVVHLESLARHREVIGHTVRRAADRQHARDGDRQPEHGHERLVAEHETSQGRHRDLPGFVSWWPFHQACTRLPFAAFHVVVRAVTLGRTTPRARSRGEYSRWSIRKVNPGMATTRRRGSSLRAWTGFAAHGSGGGAPLPAMSCLPAS